MKESITEQEAIELAKDIFTHEHHSKAYEHYSKAYEHRSKAYEHNIKASKHLSKASEHYSKAHEHHSKAYEHRSKASEHRSKAHSFLYKILSEKEIIHAVPDDEAFNVRCADREGMVYCFVWTRKELWVYDGQHCPDAETVEKVRWR